MRIISWNINGWRAHQSKPYFSNLLETYQPDIICLQEIKINKDYKIQLDGYNVYQHVDATRPGYSGTAILVKQGIKDKPIKVRKNRTEGRLLMMEFEKFVLVNVYVPNSGRKLERLDYRVNTWDRRLEEVLENQTKPIILVGDMNVARTSKDIWDAKNNLKSAGFTEEERNSFEILLGKTKLKDIWRDMYPQTTAYTYWSYFRQARARNMGWRIDYALASPEIKIKSIEILGKILGSDHAPLIVDL